MHVAHILRKYVPLEWGGTETAVFRLLHGLRGIGVSASIYSPRLQTHTGYDPFAEAGFPIRRFHSFLPVWGIAAEQRAQLVRWGGNLMSFQLFWQLMGESFDVIHTHALNRLAGVGLMAARCHGIPLVVTVHGGALDLPQSVKSQLTAPLRGGLEWGKALGLLVRSRRVLEKADAILACNPREAELLQRKYPSQRVVVQEHSVPARHYEVDHRPAARAAFPRICGKTLLLCVARLDPVKNQRWLVEQMPNILADHPNALLALAGSATLDGYVEQIVHDLQRLGLQDHVLLTGALPPGSPTLVGLMQESKAILLPSTSETFGLAIIEGWAAGTPVVSSSTSGARSLIVHGQNGWLFELDAPGEFLASLREALQPGLIRKHVTAHATQLVRRKFDSQVAATRVKDLYQELVECRKLRRSA